MLTKLFSSAALWFVTPFLSVLRLNHKRMVLVSVREYPLLLPLFALVLGQIVAGFQWSLSIKISLMCTWLVALRRSSRAGRILLLWFLVGGASTFGTASTVAPNSFKGVQSFEAEIVENPRPTGSGGFKVIARVRRVQVARRSIAIAEPKSDQLALLELRYRSLPWDNSFGLSLGDRVQISGVVKPFVPQDYFGRAGAALRRGVIGSLKVEAMTIPVQGHGSVFTFAKMRILKVLLSTNTIEGQGVLAALLLGDQSYLNQEVFAHFRDSGLLHLLVVSGYHVSLIYIFCYWLLLRGFSYSRWLGRYAPLRRLAHIVGLLIAGAYSAVVGMSVSVVRSLIMLVCVAESKQRRGVSGLLHGLILALLIMSLLWPGVVVEPGLQLGCAALLGILVGRGVEHYGVSYTWLRVVFFVWTFTQSISWLWFGDISIVAAFSTTVLGALFVLLMQLGFGVCIWTLLCLPGEQELFGYLTIAAHYLVDIVRLLFPTSTHHLPAEDSVPLVILLVSLLFVLRSTMVCINRWCSWQRVYGKYQIPIA